MLFLLSSLVGCSAHFSRLEDVDVFLKEQRDMAVAEKAVPRSAISSSSVAPMTGDGQAALRATSDFGPASLVFVPLAAVQLASTIIKKGVDAGTADEERWRVLGAQTRFGRYVELARYPSNLDIPEIRKQPSIVTEAVKAAGPPPTPCVQIATSFDLLNASAVDGKWAYDKERHIIVGLADKVKYGASYMTAKPEMCKDDEACKKALEQPGLPPYCTMEMAEQHFRKIVKKVEEAAL
jgi:hypothetical protein